MNFRPKIRRDMKPISNKLLTYRMHDDLKVLCHKSGVVLNRSDIATPYSADVERFIINDRLDYGFVATEYIDREHELLNQLDRFLKGC